MEAGVYSEKVWELMCDLLQMGVPLKNIGEVVHSCTEVVGVLLTSVPNQQSVAYIELEASLVSQAQYSVETASSDYEHIDVTSGFENSYMMFDLA